MIQRGPSPDRAGSRISDSQLLELGAVNFCFHKPPCLCRFVTGAGQAAIDLCSFCAGSLWLSFLLTAAVE